MSWLALAQVAGRLSGLVVTAILARLLAPEDFGLIALTAVAVGLLSIFTEVGLNSALIQKKEVRQEHLTSAFWLSISVGFSLAILGAAAAPLIAGLYSEPRLAVLLPALLLTLPLSGLAQVPDALLKRRMAFRQIACIDWASSLVAGLAGVALAFAGAGVWALVVQSIVVTGLSAFARLAVARWRPDFDFRLGYVREMLTFSASVLGCTLVNFLCNNVDNALIGNVLGVQSLGYYALAFNLVMLPSMTISGIVTRVMFPALASIQDDLPRFRRGYLRMLRVISSVSLPAIVGLGATAPLLITTVYGERWAPAVPVLRVLAVIGALQTINTSGLVFYALGRPNLLLGWSLLSLVLMTAGFAVGVRWGLMGVTWAYVAVSPVVWLGPHVIANRLIELSGRNFMRAISPSLFAVFCMGAVVAYMAKYRLYPARSSWVNLLVLVGTGAAVYVASYAGMGMLLGRGRGGLLGWLTGRHLAEINNEIRIAS